MSIGEVSIKKSMELLQQKEVPKKRISTQQFKKMQLLKLKSRSMILRPLEEKKTEIDNDSIAISKEIKRKVPFESNPTSSNEE